MAKKYVKQDPITHILTRPDMYVGSKTFKTAKEYVWAENELVKREVSISPALLRIFVEIVSNAIDNAQRSIGSGTKCTMIKVKLSPTECEVINDGEVIPIEKTEAEGIYNHSLIFGHLLSGSNYDDTEKRYTSGRNGLGAKLTNVFSSKFTVEGVDPENHLKLVQTWTSNMKTTEDPQVTKSSRTTGYTSVKWTVDFSQFGLEELPQDILDVYAKYVLDAAITTGLKVTLNGTKLPNKLAKYVELLNPENAETLKLADEQSKVIVFPSQTREYEAISFVNGVRTKNGGKHVDAWVEAVCRPILKKLKGSLTLRDVKPFFNFVVISTVVNPEFDSQEKNTLESPGVTSTPITPAQLNRILKWEVGAEMKELVLTKEKKKVVKAIAVKHPVIDGYDRANNSGGSKSAECTLIVCEGLSAKTFAVAGINHGLYGKRGRDWFGVFPLRGKLLNARNATPATIGKNVVITNLMKIIGLDFANPDNLKKLAYGRLCIITDADVDGIHIEGLILNFFNALFPKLLESGFVVSMKTPILKIITPAKSGVKSKYFFDERTYGPELQQFPASSKTKYYKGLGTTKPEDVKDIFGIKMLEFVTDEETDESFKIAFDKAKTKERKEWLETFNPNAPTQTLDDEKETIISYSATTHMKEELVKFSYDDCKRSLPSVFDGLKESQRKIVYAAKKRNLTTEVKVAQFGAYASEHTNYHHGEQNMFDTIIKMAQSFPGTNNIPLLSQEGMFGTRLEGGKDAASPRYIFTKVTPEFQTLFPAADDELYQRRVDDGDMVEPKYYVPVLPILLVNGCVGIGTGWSCNVPQFAPKDVIENCKLWIAGDPLMEMKPWFQGFTGTIEKVADNKFETKGIYTRTKNIIRVTELPVGLWNEKFKTWVGNCKEITKMNDRSTTEKPEFELVVRPEFDEAKLEKELTTTYNTNNMVVFDKHESITKVTVEDIFDMWGSERLEVYTMRKAAQIGHLSDKIFNAEQKIKFIELVRAKKIILTEPEDVIIDIMNKNDITKAETQQHLLQLPIRTLTENKRKELEKQRDSHNAEKKTLEATTEQQMWLTDIQKIM